MEKLSHKSLNRSWVNIVNLVLNEGIPIRSRGRETLELEDIFIEYPETKSYVFDNPVRKINPVFHLVELFYFLCGRSDSDSLTKYMSQMDQFVDKRTGFLEGSYGPSIYEALPYCLAQLKDDSMSRRAVIPIIRQSHIVNFQSKDIPCNLSITMRIRFGKLNFSVATRSQDLFRGFIYDTLEFQLLQFLLAKYLDVLPGTYAHHIHSAHIYYDDITNIKESVREEKMIDSENPFVSFSGIFPYAQKIMAVAELFTEPEEDDDIANAICAFRSRYKTENIGIYTEWVNRWLEERKKKD